jgi:hypothetical protein
VGTWLKELWKILGWGSMKALVIIFTYGLKESYDNHGHNTKIIDKFCGYIMNLFPNNS